MSITQLIAAIVALTERLVVDPNDGVAEDDPEYGQYPNAVQAGQVFARLRTQQFLQTLTDRKYLDEK